MAEDVRLSTEGTEAGGESVSGGWRPLRWLTAALYDAVLASTEEACLSAWRRELLGDVKGVVVEIGAGTGVNLPWYPEGLTDLIVSEPDAHMRRRLAARAAEVGRAPRILASPAEALPLAAGSADVVVSTLVCCTVGDPAAALSEAYRVLKPGGRLVFIEHVAAEDNPGRLAWQRRIEPLWRVFAGNCHLTRRTAATMEAAGFVMEDVVRQSLRKAPPFVRPSIRGVAVKPA